MGNEDIKKIESFKADHDRIREGMYVSRKDGGIVTYDLRTRIPNGGDYMDNLAMHSMEHMFATYIRNSDIGDRVIYFGPMGCQTGFYLLTEGLENDTVYDYVIETLEKILSHTGPVFGAQRKECGNYLNLSLAAAQKEAARFLSALTKRGRNYEYDKNG